MTENLKKEKQNLLGLDLEEMAKLLVPLGAKSFVARQIFGWIYAKGTFEFELMKNLSKPVRQILRESFEIGMPSLAGSVSSAEGRVVKYLLSLSDRKHIECVLIGMRDKDTFCVSSQVGCRFHCTFCATGKMGLRRNLNPSEILGQVLFLRAAGGAPEAAPQSPASTTPPTPRVETEESTRAFNIVFMGMGEPLDNYDNLVKAVRVMQHPDGLAVGGRRVTVSTCGVPHQIRRLAKENLGVGLALSLNATTDHLRVKLLPVAGKFSLKEVVEAVRYFAEKSGRRVTLEYVLIAGVNDRPDDAKRLATIASSIPCKINLIEFNSCPGMKFVKPSSEVVERFIQILYPRAPAVTLRKSKGSDIMAACGQLGAAAEIQKELRQARRRET